MKKLLTLLTVVAMSVTYSFAQNANSGVTVSHTNGVWFVTTTDCDGNSALAPVISVNTVTKANGFLKSVQTFDISAECTQVTQATTQVIAPFIFFDKVRFHQTPGGILKIITEINPNKK